MGANKGTCTFLHASPPSHPRWEREFSFRLAGVVRFNALSALPRQRRPMIHRQHVEVSEYFRARGSTHMLSFEHDLNVPRISKELSLQYSSLTFPSDKSVSIRYRPSYISSPGTSSADATPITPFWAKGLGLYARTCRSAHANRPRQKQLASNYATVVGTSLPDPVQTARFVRHEGKADSFQTFSPAFTSPMEGTALRARWFLWLSACAGAPFRHAVQRFTLDKENLERVPCIDLRREGILPIC